MKINKYRKPISELNTEKKNYKQNKIKTKQNTLLYAYKLEL